MSDWRFWDWVAYAILFVAAMIIAIDTGIRLSPVTWPHIPEFLHSGWWGFAPLALLIIATLILLARGLGWIGRRKMSASAEISLRIHGDDRAPTKLTEKNVWAFYYLRNEMTTVHPQSGAQVTRTIGNLVLIFDNPIRAENIDVSADFALPRFEVKSFMSRYALIAFTGALPAGTLHIKAYPWRN